GIEFRLPSAIGAALDDHIRNERFCAPGFKNRSGLRIELAQLGDHVAQIFGIDPAQLSKTLKIASCDQIEMGEEPLHKRIEAVFLLKLKSEAFGQVPRANARRVEFLQHA